MATKKISVWMVIGADGEPLLGGTMLAIYSARSRARMVAKEYKGRAVKAMVVTDGKAK